MLADEQQAGTQPQFGLVFLIGFMGCGKTTLGKKLAAKLQYPFIDLDEVLEQQAGMTIAQYFKEHGEAQFRELESSVLKDTVYPQNAIVSTGGGLPCFFDNMDWMNSKGTTAYIKLVPKALAERLENGKADRPLLREKHGDALVAFIADKLNERESFYSQANLIIDGLGITAAKTVAALTSTV